MYDLKYIGKGFWKIEYLYENGTHPTSFIKQLFFMYSIWNKKIKIVECDKIEKIGDLLPQQVPICECCDINELAGMFEVCYDDEYVIGFELLCWVED